MKLTDKKYFCYELYKNISVRSHNGEIRYDPCSFWQDEPLITSKDTLDIHGAINSPQRRATQHSVENDQPLRGCAGCYKEEEHGLVSRRMNTKSNYEDFQKDTDLTKLTGIDYALGNVCNLKCVICDSQSSSSWNSDWIKLYPAAKDFSYKKHEQIPIDDLSALRDLTFIHMHGGGEPLLSDAHINLLKSIDDKSQIRLTYNVNGTVRPSQKVLELWEKCKLVELYFSIDDIGERFNYQRTNANWDSVVENIEWYKINMPHNGMFNINCVWSALNIYYLDQLVDWKKQYLDTNRYGDPVNLIFQRAIGNTELTHLNLTAQQALLIKFKNYPELLALVKNIPVKDEPLTFFVDYIHKLDKIRNSSYKNDHQEWAELI